MGITVNVEGGTIHEGDTKPLVVSPKDADGNAVTPASLTAIFTAVGEGTSETYTLSDFTASGDSYVVYHTYDGVGNWEIDVTTTDSNGYSEGDGDTVRVRKRTSG